MNYRHAFHAGSFADVAKHAVLALIVERLKAKDSAFRVIDTHAGIGRYDLSSGPAERTGEWRTGIGRLLAATPPKPLAELLAPYLDAVRSVNSSGGLRYYPGSPRIVRHLLRRQDRLTAVELHPEDAKALAKEFAGDRQVRVVELDGWLALPAFVPPKERRGLVLVDPPFEAKDEFDRLATTFLKAHQRWPGGIYALWYPVKDRPAVSRFLDELKLSGVPRLVAAELHIRGASEEALLDGTGLVIANPPWRIEEEIRPLLKGLAKILGQDAGATHSLEILAGETPIT